MLWLIHKVNSIHYNISAKLVPCFQTLRKLIIKKLVFGTSELLPYDTLTTQALNYFEVSPFLLNVCHKFTFLRIEN